MDVLVLSEVPGVYEVGKILSDNGFPAPTEVVELPDRTWDLGFSLPRLLQFYQGTWWRYPGRVFFGHPGGRKRPVNLRNIFQAFRGAPRMIVPANPLTQVTYLGEGKFEYRWDRDFTHPLQAREKLEILHRVGLSIIPPPRLLFRVPVGPGIIRDVTLRELFDLLPSTDTVVELVLADTGEIVSAEGGVRASDFLEPIPPCNGFRFNLSGVRFKESWDPGNWGIQYLIPDLEWGQ